jgi:hypothetical protein
VTITVSDPAPSGQWVIPITPDRIGRRNRPPNTTKTRAKP